MKKFFTQIFIYVSVILLAYIIIIVFIAKKMNVDRMYQLPIDKSIILSRWKPKTMFSLAYIPVESGPL